MRLSAAFAKEGDTLKAIEVLDFSIDKLPIKDFDHYSLSMEYPEMYYKLGQEEKARETAKTLITLFKDQLIWYSTFSVEDFDMVFDEFDVTFRYLYRGIIDQVVEHDTDEDFVKKLQEDFNQTISLFSHIIPEEE